MGRSIVGSHHNQHGVGSNQGRSVIINRGADRKESLIRLGFSSYAEYLDSPLWKAICDKVRDKQKDKCRCGRAIVEFRQYRHDVQTMNGNALRFVYGSCGECDYIPPPYKPKKKPKTKKGRKESWRQYVRSRSRR